MEKPGWWHSAVIYRIHPGSLEGNLEYVASLGVDAVWISPFRLFPRENVARLLARAHALGLKVVICPIDREASTEHAGQQASLDDVKSWLDCGVDGLWLDVIEPNGLPGQLDILSSLRALVASTPVACWAGSMPDVPEAVTRCGEGSSHPDLASQCNALSCSLEGPIVIPQGSELGLPETDAHRAPSVATQEADPDSTLQRFRRFLHWRHRQPALMAGDLRFLDAPAPVLAFERTHPEQRFLVVFNLSDEPQTVVLPGLENLTADPGHGLPAGKADDRQVFLPARGVYYAVTPAG